MSASLTTFSVATANGPLVVSFKLIVASLRDLNNGVQLCKSKSKGIDFCFSGKALVDWIFENFYKQTQPKSVCAQVAAELLKLGVFSKAEGNSQAVDDASVFYRFEKAYARRILIIGSLQKLNF